jgi:putative transposase
MRQYRRVKIEGSMFFFTVVLADRSSRLLLDQIDHLRQVYRSVRPSLRNRRDLYSA